MKIGVPKEIKNHEYRVGLVPSSVRELTRLGHQVFMETFAGLEIGFSDRDYQAAGAEILKSPQEIFSVSDMIVKVKEPQPSEYPLLKEDQILFTYLHLAPDPQQTQALIRSKCVAIAYETVTDSQGRLPLLAPMSEVAGKMSIQVAASFLEKEKGGAGVLMGGIPGVEPAVVTVIGGGVVGSNAARIALGMGAEVNILDKNPQRLNELDWMFGGKVKTIFASHENVSQYVKKANVVVGAVLVAGGAAPKIVSREMIASMGKGSVVVDVAIDQGGCFETSKPTSHQNPTYLVEGIIHYCVTNMPGAVARTSAMGLNNATLPFVLDIAQKGYRNALINNVHLRNGLNVFHGQVTQELVAQEMKLPFADPMSLL